MEYFFFVVLVLLFREVSSWVYILFPLVSRASFLWRRFLSFLDVFLVFFLVECFLLKFFYKRFHFGGPSFLLGTLLCLYISIFFFLLCSFGEVFFFGVSFSFFFLHACSSGVA